MKSLRNRIDLSRDPLESITMMQLRRSPGEILDQVLCGKRFNITRNGKICALIRPPEIGVIHPDGSWSGERPLTMGKSLGEV